MAQDDSKPGKRTPRPFNPLHRWRKPTTYYPVGETEDGPAPISPVAPVQFQPIVPSYDLSPTERPDYEALPHAGATPTFPKIEPGSPLPEEAREEGPQKGKHKKGKPAPGTGNRLDMDA